MYPRKPNARPPIPGRPLSNPHNSPRVMMVPCSCGTTFVVPACYDQQGLGWSRFLKCPTCGKPHDPRNRLLQVGYQSRGFWTVDDC
jgi:hypothetical protein